MIDEDDDGVDLARAADDVAGDAADVAQRPGLHADAARIVDVLEALLECAVEAAEGERGQELRRVAALARADQELRHAVRRDAGLARQSRTVADDEFRQLESARL